MAGYARARARVCVSRRFPFEVPFGGETERLRLRHPCSGPHLSRVPAERCSPYSAPQILRLQAAGTKAQPHAPSTAGRGEDRVLLTLRQGTGRGSSGSPPGALEPLEVGAAGSEVGPSRGRGYGGACKPFHRPPRGGLLRARGGASAFT